MRLPLLGAALAALFVFAVSAAAEDSFSLTVVSQTNSTITFSYPQQSGYGYLYSANGIVVSQTNDPTKTTVKFSKNAQNDYEVASKVKGTTGRYQVAPPPPPPPPPPGDTTAPSSPGNLRLSSATQTKIVVAWDASTDNVGVVDYRVYRDGAVRGTTDNTLDWADFNLTCGTSYTYAVEALDAAGNASQRSSVTVSTLSCSTPPPSGGYPDASNTGVPAGTTLTAYTGPTDITVANTVIDSKTVGCLAIRAPGVIIRNSRISSGGCYNVVQIFSGDVTIEDSEISCQNSNNNGLSAANAVLRRVEISGCENGINLGGPMTVEDSWIHGLVTANGAHTDGIQVNQGAGNFTIRHNTIDQQTGISNATSCIIMWDEGDPQNHDALIDNNRLLGGGAAFTIYTPRQGPLTNVRVTNNRLTVGYFGYNGGNGSLLTDGSGNVNDTTGAPLSL